MGDLTATTRVSKLLFNNTSTAKDHCRQNVVEKSLGVGSLMSCPWPNAQHVQYLDTYRTTSLDVTIKQSVVSPDQFRCTCKIGDSISNRSWVMPPGHFVMDNNEQQPSNYTDSATNGQVKMIPVDVFASELFFQSGVLTARLQQNLINQNHLAN